MPLEQGAAGPHGGEGCISYASLAAFYASPLTHFLSEVVIFQATHSWPELDQKVWGLLRFGGFGDQ